MLHWLQPVWKIGFGALLIALLLAGLPAAAAALSGEPDRAPLTATRLYVDRDAAGPAHDGLAWTTAYTTVQDALDWANAHGSTPCEIWVAEGVYYPDEGGNHIDNAITETFTLAWNNVQLYGGFAGTEALRTGRDWAAHPTILSGDLDKNDPNTDGNFINEVYSDTVGSNARVLYLDGATHQPITGATVIDGFIITAGKAVDNGELNSGGGLFCNGKDSGHECSPTLTHLTFSGNLAGYAGGGISNDGRSGGAANPQLTHVIFTGNRAGMDGGAIYNYSSDGGTSSPILTHVTFSNNRAELGGGIFAEKNNGGINTPQLTHVTFSGNRAGNGGGMFSLSSSPVLTNVVFSGNQVNNVGGGMFGYNSDPTLVNVTLSGNRAGKWGGGMYNGSSRPNLTNCILWGNAAPDGPQIYNDSNVTPTLTYSNIEGGYTGTGNLDLDPQFIAPIAASAAPTTAGNYRLNEGSPAIDAGNALSVTAATDLDGNPRIQGDSVDLGAYETNYRIIYAAYLPLTIRNN